MGSRRALIVEEGPEICEHCGRERAATWFNKKLRCMWCGCSAFVRWQGVEEVCLEIAEMWDESSGVKISHLWIGKGEKE